MTFVCRVALPGYDALTDTNLDHFALYADEDNVLVKEKMRGGVGIQSGSSVTITHSLGYVPMVFVFGELSTGEISMVLGDNADVSATYEVNSTSLIIYNSSGSQKVFQYVIFYDKQV